MIKINWDNELALARVDQTVNRLVTAPFSPGFQSPLPVREINPSLASQEPCFSRYPADLIFTDENDPAGQPGDTQTALDYQGSVNAATDSRILRFLMGKFKVNLVSAVVVCCLAWAALGLVVLWLFGGGK